jgi:FkbM family methyltransferase
LLSKIPESWKRVVRDRIPALHLEQLLAPCLPPVLCVDVGASYYPHPAWQLLRRSSSTRWLAVDPNAQNLAYVKDWSWPCSISACETGLSEAGGEQTLYITNVDSGSSLLPPVIADGLKHRILNLSYFFPLRERRIETKRLPDVIASQPGELPTFVKLDTQGTELSILRAADSLLRQHRIVGVELEATLLAQPVMKGAGKFWEACRYLEDIGFELLRLKPIPMPSRLATARGNTPLNECDAVFALRADLVATLPVEHRLALLAFYACYALYEEAQHVLADAEVRRTIEERDGDLGALERCLRRLA